MITREREREREQNTSELPKIQQLKSEIQELESISNKTTHQKQELKDKKEQLKQLEKSSTQQPKTNYWPWIIGGFVGGGLIIGLVVWLVMRNKNKEM